MMSNMNTVYLLALPFCNCHVYARVEKIYEVIDASISKRSILVDFQLNKLPLVISRITALMGILVCI